MPKGFSIIEECAQWLQLEVELYQRRFADDDCRAPLPREDTDEPEVVERAVRMRRSLSGTGYNRRMEKKSTPITVKRTWSYRVPVVRDGMIVGHARHTGSYDETVGEKFYFAQAQRCHSGVDSRRYRRGDTTGKMIGGNHRRRSKDYDSDHPVLRPVAVLLDTSDGVRRLRVA